MAMMTLFRNFPMSPYLDAAGDGTGGGDGTGAAGTGTAAGAAGAAGTGAAGAAGAGDGAVATRTGAAASGFTYAEDRSRWIPPHRLSESTTQVTSLKEQLAERDRKIAALAGVATASPDDAKATAIKEAFFKLPGMGIMQKLAGLTEEQLDKMMAAADGVDSVKQNELKGWQRHGNEQVSYIAQGVAEALGTDTLDKEQSEDLRISFSTWLKRTVQAEFRASEGQESATLEAYEAGDKKLLDQFIQGYTKRWVEPARRTQAARTSTRTRPVPNSQGRSQVSTVNRPEKFKSLDDRLDFAVGLAREAGVFSR